MTGLIRRTFVLNEQETNYVSIYLNDDLKQVKTGTLVTFKRNIPKNKVHRLGDSRHTLSVFCGRYICITSENTWVCLSKKDRSLLMNLKNACINRQVIKFCRLQEELVERWNRWLRGKTYCEPPNTNAIDFLILWDELRFGTRLFEQWYPS
jgi:hypothetical protein